MTPKEVIRNTMETAQQLTEVYLSDFGDTDLFVRSVPGANHVAWQLGHMISSEHEMVAGCGLTMPKLPDGFAEAYTKETSTSDDRAKFRNKEQYFAWLQEQRAGTLAALEALPEKELERPTPEPMHEYAKTVGVMFNMVGVHQLMHAAQFVPIRRKLGKPILI